MEKEFIEYSEALALKELGFDEPCFGAWVNNELFITENENPKIQSLSINQCTAPLYQQAFGFFREKYEYDVTIKKCTPSEYKFEIEQLFAEGDNYYFIDFVFKSHKEAELKCLSKLIEIVKRK